MFLSFFSLQKNTFLSFPSVKKEVLIRQQVLASGKGMRQNIRTTIAGKSVVYDLTIEPLHDNAGAVVGITCASLDVTGQLIRQQGRERTDSGANGTLPSKEDGDNR